MSGDHETTVPDYRTNAILDHLTAVGVHLEQWQVDYLDRMMLESDKADDDE